MTSIPCVASLAVACACRRGGVDVVAVDDELCRERVDVLLVVAREKDGVRVLHGWPPITFTGSTPPPEHERETCAARSRVSP
jgi:hypothetical protein